MSFVEEGFAVLQDCVRAARRAKQNTSVPLKGNPFLVRFKIPFAIGFSINRDDNGEVIRKMLKAEEIYLEEEGFDSPFESTDMAERFPNFGGDADSGKVKAQLWTSNPIW
jgi:hypothetical protein